MAKISKCPKCEEAVLIPDHADADLSDESLLVQCPLCEAEFPVTEAAEEATDAPPSLVFVNLPVPEEPAEDEQEGPSINIWERVDEAPSLDLGGDAPDDAADGDAAAFTVSDDEDEEETAASSGGPQRSRPRKKKKKKKGALRMMVEVVFGGVLGLLGALYILNFFWPHKAKDITVPLPGIPHTYKHAETLGWDWWPWPAPEGEGDDEAGSEGEGQEDPPAGNGEKASQQTDV
ncbi:MAG: hypothetical protein HQ581_13745 [Planctomycetes bacterium]|nr:hypothetical protein [Planctomycetota bacterium]